MNSHVPVLIPEPASDAVDIAFKGDKLNRVEIAEQLTGYISRLARGSVIAIDAPWGEGKTWFARHWLKYLNDRKYKTLYIDAFKQDYIEDPFILISAEFSNLLNSNAEDKQKFVGSAAKIGKVLLPTIGKIAVNIAGNLAGVSNLSEKISDGAEGPLADLIEESIESKIKEYDADKATMQSFRESIASYAAKSEKPVIILIDELDRCRPTFAIQLIERIKHFFDVPNLVFVLFVNRSQLDRSIEVLYGLQPESSTYLSKFINMQFSLPKGEPSQFVPTGPYNLYINNELEKYRYTPQVSSDLSYFLDVMACTLDLSLRDIERACHYIAIASNNSRPFLCYLSAIKAKHPDLFTLLENNSIAAHEKCISILNEGLIRLGNNITSGRSGLIKTIVKYHKCSIGIPAGADQITSEDNVHLGSRIDLTYYEPNKIISIIAKKIDLMQGRAS